MADAFSLGIGIISFIAQVGIGIEKLRSTIRYNETQAPQDLEFLGARLEIILQMLIAMQTSQTSTLALSILAQCRCKYDRLDAQLGKVLLRFPPKSASGRQNLRSKARNTLADNRAKIEALQTGASQIIELLMLVIIPSMSSALRTLEASYDSSIGRSTERPSGDSGESIGRTIPTKIPQGLMVSRRPRAICNCAGPSTISRSGSFWWLYHSAVLFPRRPCDSETCNRRKLSLRLRVSLLRFGFSRALTASLEYVTGSHSSSIRPALTTQQIVRNTSPVFVELWKCKNGKSSFEESRDTLRSLFKANSHFQRHADAEGHSYLWHLVSYGPWVIAGQDAQFKMIELFVTEFEMNFSKEDPSLLIGCAMWIGEGRHLDLLDSVLENGFEPYESVAPAASDWPKPCDDNWISLQITPDPFFVEYFTMIVKAKPDFSGITDFQVLLLSEQPERIQMYLSRPTSRHMVQEVNFLQQTSLHMAVGQPLLLKRLIDFIGDQSAIDVRDRWEFTPLMYAAASGYTESVVMLISKGANPFARDRQGRTFLSLAIDRGHWELLMACLNAIRLEYDHERYQALVRHSLVRSIARPLHEVEKQIRRKYVVQLIFQCDDVNFPTKDFYKGVTDKTLMSWIDTIEEARALVGQGFTAFKMTDSLGQLPIHSLKYNLELVKFCLDHGTDVNHMDKNGDTLLLTLLSALSSSDWRTPSIMRALRFCLERGADYSTADKCRCPCSPKGCSSSSVFSHAFDHGFRSRVVEWIWSFEWVSILEDYRGTQAAREVLCSLIRGMKFDQLEMTHVCCHRGRSKPVHHDRLTVSYRERRVLEDGDIDDIIEEESEFVQILDQEMEEVSRLSLKELRKEYMLLLYGEYSKNEANVKKERAEQRSNISARRNPVDRPCIDYKADVIVGPCYYFPMETSYPIATELAMYVGCLEFEMSRHQVCQEDTHMEGDVWYRKRLQWVIELMDVFKVSLPQIRESIPWRIVLGEVQWGQQESMAKVLKDHFTSSVRSMRGCIP